MAEMPAMVGLLRGFTIYGLGLMKKSILKRSFTVKLNKRKRIEL
jgi:hypothetical protein